MANPIRGLPHRLLRLFQTQRPPIRRLSPAYTPRNLPRTHHHIARRYQHQNPLINSIILREIRQHRQEIQEIRQIAIAGSTSRRLRIWRHVGVIASYLTAAIGSVSILHYPTLKLKLIYFLDHMVGRASSQRPQLGVTPLKDYLEGLPRKYRVRGRGTRRTKSGNRWTKSGTRGKNGYVI